MSISSPLRELLGKATPGPWKLHERIEPPEIVGGVPFCLVTGDHIEDDPHPGAQFVAPPVHTAELRIYRAIENAALIVALRNLAEPYIVDVLDAAAEQKKMAGGKLDNALLDLRSALDREGLGG